MSVGDKIRVVMKFYWRFLLVNGLLMRPIFLRLQTNASGREHTLRMSPKYGKAALKS